MSGTVAFGAAWSAARRRLPEPELESWLALAHDICDEADALALAAFRHHPQVRAKADHSLVTEADEAIEALVRRRIESAHPDHGLVGEETGESSGAGLSRWYIDPIDATHNFVRGVPVFATLLAAEHDGELQLGVISAPALGQRWYARRGGGAWARPSWGPTAGLPRRIATSGVAELAKASLAYSSPGAVAAVAPAFPSLLATAWRDRGFGDFWGYALLAEGAVDAMVEVGVHSWDLAAPSCIVEEAGGRVGDLAGRRTFSGPTMVASNGPLHEALLAALGPPPRDTPLTSEIGPP